MKTITRLTLVASIAMFTQLTIAQVGIGTTSPLQELHIAGTDPATKTIRIDAFNSTNSPTNNNGVDLAPLAVNANGDVVLGGHAFLSNIEVDDDETVFINPTVYVRTTDGSLQSGSLATKSITLTQQTLVEVNYNISCGIDNGSSSDPAISGPITDNLNRTYGAAIFINGTLEGANAQAYSNGDRPTSWSTTGHTATFNSGYFTLNGSVYKILPAGNHTITMSGYVIGAQNIKTANGNITDAATVGAEFGDGYSRLMVIKHN